MISRRIAFATVTIALLGALTVMAVQFHRDLRAADIRASSGSHLLPTPCGPIEYAVSGRGPPVLIVHGAGGGFDQGLQFAEPLVRGGFTVIAPSRFGYLRAPLPRDASPEAQADAHACLLDALGVQQVTAIGGSAGAPSVMQLCLRHSEKCSGMILVVPLAFAPREEAAVALRAASDNPSLNRTILSSDWVLWVATKLARDALIETLLATPIADFERASQAEQRRVLAILRNIQPISRRAQGLLNDAAVAGALPRYELERITTPTLIVTAEDDLYGTYAGSRYTAQHMAQARLIAYQTGGHLWVGHQEEVWAAVVEFLSANKTAQAATMRDTAPK